MVSMIIDYLKNTNIKTISKIADITKDEWPLLGLLEVSLLVEFILIIIEYTFNFLSKCRLLFLGLEFLRPALSFGN